MSSSERINAWQSGKLQQRLEKGTMCTKRWCKRKFVPSGFLPCWLRSTTFSKKVSSQLKKDMLLKVMTFFTVLTCNESWFHHFGNKMTEQGMASHDTAPPPPKKSQKQGPQCIRQWELFFWDDGSILVKFLPHWETINVDCYLQTLQKLHHALCDKHPGKKKTIPQHRNTWPHTVCLCMQRLQKKGCELLCHPPSSPDLTARTIMGSGSRRIRCKASTVWPMRQSTKPSIIVYELLKQCSTARGSSNF